MWFIFGHMVIICSYDGCHMYYTIPKNGFILERNEKWLVDDQVFLGDWQQSFTCQLSLQKVEERRTVQDGVGHAETTIIRRMGDQEHSITTKRTPDGTEAQIENFVNMDEGIHVVVQ